MYKLNEPRQRDALVVKLWDCITPPPQCDCLILSAFDKLNTLMSVWSGVASHYLEMQIIGST